VAGEEKAMEFVLIPGGAYMMGGSDHYDNPRHEVIITKPFYIGKYEVTQQQWMHVMDYNPSAFKGPQRPVENVSWEEVQEFIRRLNRRKSGIKYRLPTEAEWEYAARYRPDESTDVQNGGTSIDNMLEYGWYLVNSKLKTHPVGKLKPNSMGIHDMYGNVSEWCEDRYDKKYYEKSPLKSPRGPRSGNAHVYRGGSWGDLPDTAQPTYRNSLSFKGYGNSLGFRLVC